MFALCLPSLEEPEKHSGYKEGSPIHMPTPNTILSDTLSPESVVVLSPFPVTTVTTSNVAFVTVAISPIAEIVT
jgi:hypothetical protein